jgi:small conductance mechanosensitive channel
MIFKTLKAVIVITIFLFINSVSFSNIFAATVQNVEELEQVQARIERINKRIKDIQRRVNEADGITKDAFDARLDKAWLTLLEQNLFFAESVAALEGSGTKMEKYRKQAVEILNSQIEIASAVGKRFYSRIKIPEPGLPAAEQAAADTKVFALLDSLNLTYDLSIQNFAQLRQFKIDVTEQEMLFKKHLAEYAANGSILLEMAMDDVTALHASVSAVPDDKESQGKLTVGINRVDNFAVTLDAVLVMMESLGMDTSDYQGQIISATGQITVDFFNIGVFTQLLGEWWQSLWNVITEGGPDLIFNVLLFLLVIYGFYKLANIAQKLIERGLAKSQLQLSELLRRMVVSIARNCIIVLGILVALSQFGINLGPLLAGLGVVGFVIGFALQDALSNFAAGAMILIYRPFDVGDLVEIGGVSGKVNNMSLVNTTVLTLDNQTLIIPNSKIWGDVVKNVTAQTMRRVDLKFGISYGDDIPKTERILQEIIDSHDKILTEPKSIVRLHELADSSVNFVVYTWVDRDDYWDVYWDLTRSVKMRFDEEGISIPFPQRDVHVSNQDSL